MWFSIAFYLVTAALSYLLTPRPKAPPRPQDAKPQAGEAPEARTSGAVPVVFGTAWISPNVVWYGDLSASEITECVESEGGGKK